MVVVFGVDSSVRKLNPVKSRPSGEPKKELI